jgi:ketosteroid isomerase-like protein
MRLRLIVAAVSAIVACSAGRASAVPLDPVVLRPVTGFIHAINAGDTKAFARLFTADAVACDEVPPYRWLGPNAVAHWLHDDDRLITAHHITDAVISVGTPTYFHRGGNGAYATYPLVDAYTVHGKRQRETGLFTFALADTRAGWRITLACFAKEGDTSDASWDGE